MQEIFRTIVARAAQSSGLKARVGLATFRKVSLIATTTVDNIATEMVAALKVGPLSLRGRRHVTSVAFLVSKKFEDQHWF